MSKADSTEASALSGRGEACNFCDYFVILTASSGVRAGAIADKIRQALEEKHALIKAQEGREDSGWILLDLYDVIAHIFVGREIREFYNLDRLWGFCPAVELPSNQKCPSSLLPRPTRARGLKPKKDVKRLTRRAPCSTVRKSTARKAKASK